jgi:predicted  nucleic acid-binding Zn-ribbon protein
MKALKTLGFLGGNNGAAEPPPEDGRVVELFRSRAELRKQHEELGAEMQRLRDRLKLQEAATSRVQEMYESLEKRLEAADTGLSTLVFYHLRALWSDGREIIGLLVQDLAAKQEDRERKAWALEGNRKQFQQRQSAEQQLRHAESQIVAARQQLVAFDARLAKLDKWWHRWQRPKLVRQRPALKAAFDAADAALAGARGRCEQLEKAGAGEFPGISIDAKRAINLAAIACAEVLCLRLSRTSLVASARAAMSRREANEYYGDLAACVSIMSDIVKARHLLKQRGGITQEVAQRTERLRSTASYLGEFETVPIPETCGVSEGDVLAHGSQGVTAAKLPNVLAEDTWDLFKVLLR